ncbi:MAG: MalT-like region [Vampirovibrio sp.]|jgi:tetratricopeptide (TPR) repeat protein|nr:MalT-like region [Vampirovibrio sp.]
MMEISDSSPNHTLIIPSNSPPKSFTWLKPVIQWGLLAMTALALAVGGACWHLQIPEQTYAQIYSPPWLSVNAFGYRLKTRQDFVHARQTLLQATKTDAYRDNPLPHYLLAGLYDTLGQTSNAISAYQQVIQIANRSWYHRLVYREFMDQAQASLAICYYENNKHADALRVLSEISDLNLTDKSDLLHAIQDRLQNPGRADFHMEIGKAFSKGLKLEIAAREAKEAQKLSQSPQLKLEAANFLKTAIPKGVKELSPLARYYSLAGEVYQHEESDLIQAARLYEQVVKESPAYEWGYNDLAVIYRDLKDFANAENNARKAIALNPDFYNPHLTLGDLAIDREDFSGAIRHFQTAKRLLEQTPLSDNEAILANIENQIAYSYESQGDLLQAARHYQDALLISIDVEDENTQDYDYAQEGLARVNSIARK